MKSVSRIISAFSILLFPGVLLAAKTYADAVNRLIDIINLLIPFVVGLTIFILIFGIFRYISVGNNETELQKGKDLILYGIIGIVVMLSVWGLAIVVKSTLF